QRGGDGGRHEGAVRKAGEVHEANPVGELARGLRGDFESKAGLADATRTSKRDQPALTEPRLDTRKLRRPTDQGKAEGHLKAEGGRRKAEGCHTRGLRFFYFRLPPS